MSGKFDVRLQKFMADCGVASRRKCEELIQNGKVKVNGHPAKLGDKVDPKKDIVTLRGKRLVSSGASGPVYLMLNKPRGYVTTVHDEFGRKTVMDLVADVPGRIYPVGRLDRDSEGLLFLTNDGNFANAMTHPKHHFAKVYRVTVRPPVTDEMLDKMRGGMDLEEYKTQPCTVVVLESEANRVVLEFVIYEGRNRQIRRMCEAVGLEVARLKRVSIGSIKLGGLAVGKYRMLSEQEIRHLLLAAERKAGDKS